MAITSITSINAGKIIETADLSFRNASIPGYHGISMRIGIQSGAPYFAKRISGLFMMSIY